jgi:hypothetical protein
MTHVRLNEREPVHDPIYEQYSRRGWSCQEQSLGPAEVAPEGCPYCSDRGARYNPVVALGSL